VNDLGQIKKGKKAAAMISHLACSIPCDPTRDVTFTGEVFWQVTKGCGLAVPGGFSLFFSDFVSRLVIVALRFNFA